MRLGVDYYPEHWPESRWEEDARLMREAGFSVVRLAEFAWSRLEPRENDFRFDWLDRAMAVLYKNGISAVLGTPTAAPPAWLVEKYPDVLMRDDFGHVLGFGTRLHRCYSSANYRARARAITEAMAKRFGRDERVLGWQIDNEFDRHDCTCQACTKKWHEWLKKRYGSIEELNRRWGTVFWSQEYNDWSQVPPLIAPQCGTANHNPSLILDWRRFQSENAVSFQREQVQILRALSPGKFVTHNFMGLHDSLDYYELAADLDHVSWDNYPDVGPAGFSHDLTRGLKGRNFWVMEERSGHTGWTYFGGSPRPGELRLWTWEAIAHGADAVLFFRWRSCLYGTEQYWQGILNHDAVPRRRYREIARTGDEVRTLAKVLDGSLVENHVAIFNDYTNIWALQIQPHTSGLSYRTFQLAYAKALARLGCTFDVVGPNAELSKYKLVIFPPLYVITEQMAERIADYVDSGGIAILTCRSGVKNEDNVCRTQPLPGPLADLVGAEVVDYDAVGGKTVELEMSDGSRFKSSTWCDVLALKGAEALAMYRSGYYLGEPAMTVNRRGSGRAYYIGTLPEQSFYSWLLEPLLDELKIERIRGLPEGVEVARRHKEGRPILFVLNFSEETKRVPLPAGRLDLLTRQKEDGELELEPFGVRIYAV